MYLSTAKASQATLEQSGNCEVLISWTYGNQLPDVIEIQYTPDGASSSQLCTRLKVNGKDDPNEWKGVFPAPSVGIIAVYPRTVDGYNVLKPLQPDDTGENLDWYTFGVGCRLVTSAQQKVKKASDCDIAPTITYASVGLGFIRIEWSNPGEFDKFDVGFVDLSTGIQGEMTTADDFFILERVMASTTYEFRVRGTNEMLCADCTSPWSSPREVKVDPEKGYITPSLNNGNTITVISRNENHMEIFAIGRHNVLHSSWFDGIRWHMWSPVAAKNFDPATPIAAVCRDADFMDVFAVDSQGKVNVAWWNGIPWRPFSPISDPVFEEKCPIAALSRDTDFMDIFAVDANGTLLSSWWNGGGWTWIDFPSEKFPSSTPVAAITRDSDHMDIFLVGSDGIVRSNWWNGDWKGWFSLPGVTFPLRSPIAAISRHKKHMEIFAVDINGVVHGNWWDGHQWHNWFTLSGVSFPPSAQLSIISGLPSGQAIFGVDTTGQVQANEWQDEWSGWFKLDGLSKVHPSFFPAIAAVSRNEEILDVFAISKTPNQEFVRNIWKFREWKFWNAIT